MKSKSAQSCRFDQSGLERRHRHGSSRLIQNAKPTRLRPNGQHTAGNFAVQRLLRSERLQAKLSFGKPGDPYEREADRVAEQVTRPPRPLLQRKCSCGGQGKGKECAECRHERGLLQRKVERSATIGAPSISNSQSAAPVLHSVETAARPAKDGGKAAIASARHPDESAVAPAAVHDVLASDAGKPLDASSRQFFESRFGRDLGHVRVHTNSRAASTAAMVNARAYTVGHHMVFAPGQHRPYTRAGRKLLAHELVHTIQQHSWSRPGRTIQRSCSASSDESFYSSASNYCRDTGFTGMMHGGQTCYREVPVRSSYWECPPADHVCFEEDGTCHDSSDRASMIESKNADGSCNIHWPCLTTMHAGKDVVPGLWGEMTEPFEEIGRELKKATDWRNWLPLMGL